MMRESTASSWHARSKEAVATLPARVQQQILGDNAADAYQLS